jgi:hypothetical protein
LNLFKFVTSLVLFLGLAPLAPAQTLVLRSQRHVFPSSPRVHSGVWGGLTDDVGKTTQSLGWTVTSGNFLVVLVASDTNATTMTGVTAYEADSTPHAMKLAAFNDGRNQTGLYFLANSPAITSVEADWSTSFGPNVTLMVAECKGMSLTADVGAPALTPQLDFVTDTTWSVGPYTVPAGALILSFANVGGRGGSFTRGTGVGQCTDVHRWWEQLRDVGREIQQRHCRRLQRHRRLDEYRKCVLRPRYRGIQINQFRAL